MSRRVVPRVRKGRPPPLLVERRVEMTLADVLELYEVMSRSDHPDDHVDTETASIRLVDGKVVITWTGMNPDHPEYRRGR